VMMRIALRKGWRMWRCRILEVNWDGALFGWMRAIFWHWG